MEPSEKAGKRKTQKYLEEDFIAEMEIEGYRWQDLERMAQTEQGGGLSLVAYAPSRCNRRKQVVSSAPCHERDSYSHI